MSDKPIDFVTPCCFSEASLGVTTPHNEDPWFRVYKLIECYVVQQTKGKVQVGENLFAFYGWFASELLYCVTFREHILYGVVYFIFSVKITKSFSHFKHLAPRIQKKHLEKLSIKVFLCRYQICKSYKCHTSLTLCLPSAKSTQTKCIVRNGLNPLLSKQETNRLSLKSSTFTILLYLKAWS